jgi:hypothetical protein
MDYRLSNFRGHRALFFTKKQNILSPYKEFRLNAMISYYIGNWVNW